MKNTQRLAKKSRKPPNLFGPYDRMDLLISLAAVGTLRRADFTRHAGLHSCDLLHVSDKAGVIARWRLNSPNLQYAFALNPAFPHAAAFRAVLRALAKAYRPQHHSTCLPIERAVPRSAERAGDIEYLFGSSVRTMTLLTLEMFGGKATLRQLHRTVPNHSRGTVKNVIAFYVKEQVLKKKGLAVSFSGAQWIAILRKLLRSIIRKNQKLTLAIRERMAAETQALEMHTDHQVGLLGSKSFERILMHLAVHGPTSWAYLFGHSKAAGLDAINIYKRLGVIASRKSGHAHSLSLNAAYPAYKELRRLLIALSGQERRATQDDWIEPKRGYEAGRLFLYDLRTAVICTLEARSMYGVDAATLSRLLPEFDRHQIREALRRYESLGTVRSYKRNGRITYTLDALWQYHNELSALLKAVNTTWPQWKIGAAATSKLQPPRLGRPKKSKRSRRGRRLHGLGRRAVRQQGALVEPAPKLGDQTPPARRKPVRYNR